MSKLKYAPKPPPEPIIDETLEPGPKKRGRKPKEKIYSVKELPKTFFEENEKNISSESNNHLIGSGGTDSHSNSVLEKVSSHLQAIGFQVEVGKKKNQMFKEAGIVVEFFD